MCGSLQAKAATCRICVTFCGIPDSLTPCSASLCFSLRVQQRPQRLHTLPPLFPLPLQASGSKCVCYPGYTTNVAGPTACGPALSESWNVSSATELAQQLCTQYSRYLELVQQVCRQRGRVYTGSASYCSSLLVQALPLGQLDCSLCLTGSEAAHASCHAVVHTPCRDRSASGCGCCKTLVPSWPPHDAANALLHSMLSLLQGLLADRLVASMYLGAFQQQAAYLLDQAAVQEAEVFWSTYVLDERMPASPTRRCVGVCLALAGCALPQLVCKARSQ